MLLTNQFHRSSKTLAIAALVIILYSVQVTAIPVTCEEYFGPSRNPHIAYCSAENQRYSCLYDSCSSHGITADVFSFGQCNLKKNDVVTQTIKAAVYVLQYHFTKGDGWVDAQDKNDGHWYRCFLTTSTLNERRPTCQTCRRS
ncbi:hypothetical protein MJO28_005607 [Puccinia striiformis f. sp. tritici]|uniref:Uncharacterized protein n=1 Tax=Puccinia striiformis f. sp. tritici TaxID=168172 RepID=A0ACC0EMW5_9BASI|nr:hypothetical protein Pst134EA_009740 [Puccinia striiformis f. sp. tritici]KAH9469212.1 hypothetical protein Pst134EA_009740 [Puccinia striiformis f. sp. tritici]KAI7955207.1 hypothetical protein MJO28_005607 [Puccinia striiformis f. sp. tritici]